MKQNTLLETIVERRNFYQGRLVESMVNVIYFTKEMAKAKPDTQERVDAKNQIEQAQKRIAEDEQLLVCFDELIKQVQAPAPKAAPKKGQK